MFDVEELAGMPNRRLLDAVAANHDQALRAGCDQLLLAAAFADDQARDYPSEDPEGPNAVVAVAVATIEGGGGRLRIDEDAVAEFGACCGVGLTSARNLIGNAVRLRWRFPILWARIREGSLPGWQAVKIAEAAVHLDYDRCLELDERLSAVAGLMAWPRFSRLLRVAVAELDADGLAARTERAATERYVRTCDSEDGLKLLIARAGAGEVVMVEAMLHRIADILAADGDTDPLPVRLARALGVIGNPALALHLLATHLDQPGGRVEPEPVTSDHGDRFVPPEDPLDLAERSHTSISITDGGIDPAAWNPRDLVPRVVLYFHLSDAALAPGFDSDRLCVPGLVRPEHGDFQSLGQLKEFLADTGCRVTVRPVVTPALEAPVDGYEIPERLRRAARLRHVVEPFPYSSCDRAAMDIDHTIPWRRGGPPGQTGLGNLAPLSRSSHRMATRGHGRWHKRQPTPGTLIWRSPHGRIFLTTGHGTVDLGDTVYSRQVWDAACPPASEAA